MEMNNRTDNIVSSQEQMVTITLSEYRGLIQSHTSKKYEIERALNDWVNARKELEKAREVIADLKGQIIKLIMPEVPTNE